MDEARGKWRKVFCRPRAEGWHFFGRVNEKVDAWEEEKKRERQVRVTYVFLHQNIPSFSRENRES